MAWLVTDLPEPDSPTMPMVLPRSRSKLSPSTDLTNPSSVGKWTLRSLTSRKGFWGVSDIAQQTSAQADARVDDAVEDVHDQVGDDDERGGDEDQRHDHGQVRLDDSLDGHAAEAVQPEHRLGDDRAAEEATEVETGGGHDRGERGAQAVPADDLALTDALGAGGADVVLAHGLEHVGTGEAHVARGEDR